MLMEHRALWDWVVWYRKRQVHREKSAGSLTPSNLLTGRPTVTGFSFPKYWNQPMKWVARGQMWLWQDPIGSHPVFSPWKWPWNQSWSSAQSGSSAGLPGQSSCPCPASPPWEAHGLSAELQRHTEEWQVTLTLTQITHPVVWLQTSVGERTVRVRIVICANLQELCTDFPWTCNCTGTRSGCALR